ncbi:MAG TPA: carboxypeptidase regulatory-like domain-containing protein, partial [Pyrinomonadaceae bacterium]|nr:carboxypeptidase regulatory-like domain-containing protein [Pyrinomonadaceae bacterium]
MFVMVRIFPEATKCMSTACLLLSLFLASFSARAWPQTQLASVFGTITDASGAVVSDAHLTFVNKSTGLKRDVSTDLNGQYRVTGLSTGSYSARVEKEGFQTQVREELALTSASEFMMNVSLTVGDLKQEVTVRADVPTIDNSTSTVGGLLPEHTLTELPLNGRDLFKAAILEPGVAPAPNSAPSLLSAGKGGQVSINGMRPSWTNVLIDGMDANDPVFGYSPAGASGLFLGINEWSEVRVLTQTFNAEYGRNGGGVIEVATKSGNNDFHGALFEIHGDAALDAKNYFDLSAAPIPAFVRNQFGAGIGGPLVRDHTFFYMSYEGFREVHSSTAVATVPDALAHEGLLPSNDNPAACSNASPNACVAVAI